MKNLLSTFIIFTAIGFSSIQANESYENITLSPEKNCLLLEQNQLLLDSDTPCADQWSQNVNALINAGIGPMTAETIADIDFETCLDETYG
jgi:cytochrome c-type biogenesis protein CcmH/NrfF